MTLISRLLGLTRDMVCSRIFGVGEVWSSFALAFLIPNLFRRLFGEGALSAAFIPTYTRLLKEDRKTAERFARLVMLVVMVFLSLLVLLGEILLFLLLTATPIGETGGLAIRLTMIMLPYMPMICAVALLGGMLQVHGRFAPTAAAPIILNLCIIAAATLLLADIRAVALAVLVAGVMQVSWSLFALKGNIDWRGPVSDVSSHMKKMLRLAGPMLIGLGALQLSTFLDGIIAGYPVTFGKYLPQWMPGSLAGATYPLDEASNAVLFYGQRLYQFPLGVFGIAIATAIYPSLSKLADDQTEFTSVLQKGLRLSLYIALPASIGLVLVARPLAATLFLGGKFDAFGVERVAAVLAAYATAVWAYAMNHLLTRAFYARNDSKTPVRVSLIYLFLNLVLNLSLIWIMGERGLAWATSVCAVLQCVTLLILLNHRLGKAKQTLLTGELFRGVMWTVVISIMMSIAVSAWLKFAQPGGGHWSDWALLLAGSVVTGGVVYLFLSLVTRRPETTWLLSRHD